ncbi:MAG: winged helix-turn-helix transcriptional regulator [Planctomycetes bacterium]|nr:winged helix-turn-helix transcriptional regulator [Planctomycetota bacterium]
MFDSLPAYRGGEAADGTWRLYRRDIWCQLFFGCISASMLLAPRLSFKSELFDSELFKGEASRVRCSPRKLPPSLLSGRMSFSDAHLHLDLICRRISEGRGLARQLASAVREHEISEAEFRLLWLLSETDQANFEQSRLIEGLGISSAQVSALVEKLRYQQFLTPVIDSKDRRRKYWKMTASGRKRFKAILATVRQKSRHWVFLDRSHEHSHSPREDAA